MDSNDHINHFPEQEDLIPILVNSWQSAGHPFGMDKHLQLREVLRSIPADSDLEILKYKLAPVFAESPQEQEEFYELFDFTLSDSENRLVNHQKMANQIHVRTPKEKALLLKKKAIKKVLSLKQNGRNLTFAMLTALLTGLASWGLYTQYFASKPTEMAKHLPQLFFASNVGTDYNFCLQNDAAAIGKPVTVNLLYYPISNVAIEPEIINGNICFQTKSNSVGRQVATYEICYSSGKCSQLEIICVVDNTERDYLKPQLVYNKDFTIASHKSPAANTSNEEKGTSFPIASSMGNSSTALDTMIMSNDPSKAVEGVTSRLSFGKGFSYFSKTKALILALMAAFIWLLGWVIRRSRQKFTMERTPSTEHPHVWNLRIPMFGQVDLGEAFHKNLRNMSRRDVYASRKIDVKQTIKSSLKKGGAIDFQYQQLRQNKEYLFLLDVSSKNDHRANVLKLFVDKLIEEGSPIEYFLFDGNPSRLWNDRKPKGISLKELGHSYKNSQLIYCSSGHDLLNSNDKTLLLKELGDWRKKLFLSPLVYTSWGAAEIELEQTFKLLPCTPQGISLLVDSLESVDNLDYRKEGDIEKDKLLYDQIKLPNGLKGDQLMAFLESKFITHQHGIKNDTLLKWIAACSIPPVLFWQWTLHVGQLLSTSIQKELSLENLFQIIRLSWFVDGKMPEDVRHTLIAWLEEKHPNWLFRLRNEWHTVLNLEENLPLLGSVAWEGHRLEVILNELLQDPNWSKRRKLELELEQLMYGKVQNDAMLVRYLEKKKNPLEAVLSKQFRQFVQEKEGLFWRLRMWVWQVPALVTCFLGLLLVHYTAPVTSFQFKDRISELAFTNDSKHLMIASGQGSLAICTKEGEWVQGIDNSKGAIVALSNQGNKYLAGFVNNSLACWDKSGAPLFLQQRENKMVQDVAFHPLDPNIVLIAYFGKKAELWNIQEDQKILELQHNDVVNSVDFSPNGELMLTGSRDKTAKIWHSSGNLQHVLNLHTDQVHAIAFSPNGQLVATASRDNTAKIWNLEGKLIHDLKGHSSDVFDVSFSPDGEQLVTASRDNKAIIWSVKNGKKKRILRGHRNYATKAVFSNDGNSVMTGDRNGLVRLWTL